MYHTRARSPTHYSTVQSDSMCLIFFFSVAFKAPRGPAGGVSVPVPALVGVSRCSWLQEGFPQPAGASAQVAEGVWGRTHCCPLPVSNLLAARIVYCKLIRKRRRGGDAFSPPSELVVVNLCCWRVAFKPKPCSQSGVSWKHVCSKHNESGRHLSCLVSMGFLPGCWHNKMQCKLLSKVAFCNVENQIVV